MRADNFLKLDLEGLRKLLSSVDWVAISTMDSGKDYNFSRNILGLTEENEGILIKKGWAPIKVVAGIYGYGVIRLTISSLPGPYLLGRLYAFVDYNYVQSEVRRVIIFDKDRSVWSEDGFKGVNWEEIFIKPYK